MKAQSRFCWIQRSCFDLSRAARESTVARMEITCVAPSLLVGPAPYDADEYEQLKAESVTAILSLQTEEDLGDRTPAEAACFVFRNVPVTDFDALDRNDSFHAA